MNLMVISKKHSYLINNLDLSTIDVGSIIFDLNEKKMYIILPTSRFFESVMRVCRISLLRFLFLSFYFCVFLNDYKQNERF